MILQGPLMPRPNDDAQQPHGARRVRGACALDCPDTCSWVVTVEDGRAIRLEGDAEHPFTRGVLCAKVKGFLSYAQSPDRLLYPLRRRGPKGRGELEHISWDDALDEIAERFARAIKEYGAQAIWPYLGSGNMGLIQGVYGAGRRLWNALGASQHAMTICTIAGGVGTGYTLGDNRVGMDPETLRLSKLIVLWGKQYAHDESSSVAQHHHGPPERGVPRRHRPDPHADRRRRRSSPGVHSRDRCGARPGPDARRARRGRRGQGLHQPAHL
jgi:anaerobic selenocysteine-containing dehydrogenase